MKSPRIVFVRVAVGMMAVTLSSFAAIQSPEERNLLTNGSFEKGMDGWEFHAHSKKGECAVDDTEKHSGKPALRIANASNDDSFLTQTVVVKPATAYQLSGWIKTEDVGDMDRKSTTGASLSIEGGFLKTESLVQTKPWTHVTLDFTTKAETEIKVGPRLGHYGRKMSGTAWFAEISLIERKADSYKDVVLADKPFAYYRLAETASTQPVADEVGNNPGSYVHEPKVGVRGAIAADHENTGVTFARQSDQYIKLSNFGNYGRSLSSGFAVEYWLKTANSTDHQTVFGTANGPDYITDFLVDIGYEGIPKRFRIYCRDDHENRFGADFFPEGKNINIYDNQWHHIVHVYDPKAGSLNERVLLYIDGARQTLTVFRKNGVPAFSDFNVALTLGAMDLRGSESDHLEGSLDEMAFYKGPLSAARILKHYRAAGTEEQLSFGR